MLSRAGVDAVPHLAERLEDIRRVRKLSPTWGSLKFSQRRTTSHLRYRMPVALRLALRKHKLNKPRIARRKLPSNVLEASHLWSVKRMFMPEQSWTSIKCPIRATDKSITSSLEIMRRSCGLHDASYEEWLVMNFAQQEDIECVLKKVFDEELAPFHTDNTGLRYMLHESEAFPNGPMCPVRLIVDSLNVKIGVHHYYLEKAKAEIENAIRSSDVECDLVHQKYYSFMLFGPDGEKIVQDLIGHRENDPAESSSDEMDICCPLTGTVFSGEEFESYFFGQRFGMILTNGNASVFSIAETEKKCMPNENVITPKLQVIKPEIYTLQIGAKSRNRLKVVLMLIENLHDAKLIWLALAKKAGCCLGSENLEALYATLNLPMFPRDYPDTDAYVAYWKSFEVLEQDEYLRRPRSKRGVKTILERLAPQAWDKVTDINLAHGPLRLMRGWHYIQAFFEEDAEQNEIPIPNLLCRVSLVSPRSAKYGCRIQAHDLICAPTQEDYEQFSNGVKNMMILGNRRVFGVVSSSHCDTNENNAIGHVSVRGLVDLLAEAREHKRRNLKRRIFVLIRRPLDSNPVWGVAFLSIAS